MTTSDRTVLLVIYLFIAGTVVFMGTAVNEKEMTVGEWCAVAALWPVMVVRWAVLTAVPWLSRGIGQDFASAIRKFDKEGDGGDG